MLKELLNSKNPNKYLKRNKHLLRKLISFSDSVDNKIWISLNKEIMHVTKTELFILNYSTKLGLRKEAEKVIKLIGSNEATEVGFKYEPISATLLAIALLEKVGGTAAKTAKFRAEKTMVRGKIKKFGEKFEGLSDTALKDFEGLEERYQNQLQGMTQTVGQNFDQLGAAKQQITRQQGSLKSGVTENIQQETVAQMQEANKLGREQMQFEYQDTTSKYSAELQNSRLALEGQLDDLKKRYARAKRHDRWYENIG